MRRAFLPLFLLLATLDLIAMIGTQLPAANGPAEWKWAYRSPGLGGLGLLVAALLMMVLTYLAAHDRPGDWKWALLLLIPLGWVLTLDLAQAQPNGFFRVLGSLASRHSFGYVFDAGLAPPTRELLVDYPNASSYLNQHSRTHPPGPLLAVRALDRIGRQFPEAHPGDGSLVSFAAESLQQEMQRAGDRGRRVPRDLPAPGTLVLLAVLLPALSALAAWPLHRLALALGFSHSAALLAATLWLLVPARSLFTPSLDQALPVFLVAAAWLAAKGGGGRSFLAGLLAAGCVFFSYGYLAALPLVLLLALLPRPAAEPAGEEGEVGSRSLRSAVVRAAALATGFLLLWIGLALFAGYDPLASFQAAMAQHRTIAVESRSYSTWLLWNPYDLLLLLGPAVAGLAAAFLRPRQERTAGSRVLAWGWWALLTVLLVSGSVRGEAGRIWLFLMPFACLFAGGAAAERWRPRSPWIALLLLAQAALILTLAANLVFVK
jgi:methylthioxylose transferase